MAHWKKYMDAKDFLFAFDLDNRDVTVTVTHVTGGELVGEQGRKTKKPIAHLKGTPKKLALNATNCKTIEQLTGTPDVDKWKDVRVTLFPTTTNFGGSTVECIRVRPYPPKDNGKGRNGNSKGRDNASGQATPEDADVPCGTCGVAPCVCASAEASDAQ